MIKVPTTTKSFYSVMCDAGAAEFVTRLVAENFSQFSDIEKILVTSKDITDIEAANELKDAATKIAEHFAIADQPMDMITSFNPLYLPTSKNLADETELTSEGEIKSVAGFSNPFVSFTMKCSTPSEPEILHGNVIYQPFELPPISQIIAGEGKVFTS